MKDFQEKFEEALQAITPDIISIANYPLEVYESSDSDLDPLKICWCYNCQQYYLEPIPKDRVFLCPHCSALYDKDYQIDFIYLFNFFREELKYNIADLYDTTWNELFDSLTNQELVDFYGSYTLLLHEIFEAIELKFLFEDKIYSPSGYTTNLKK